MMPKGVYDRSKAKAVVKPTRPSVVVGPCEAHMAVVVPAGGLTLKLMRDPTHTFGTLHITDKGVSYIAPNAKKRTQAKDRPLVWRYFRMLAEVGMIHADE
jgi:hypothetical protein